MLQFKGNAHFFSLSFPKQCLLKNALEKKIKEYVFFSSHQFLCFFIYISLFPWLENVGWGNGWITSKAQLPGKICVLWSQFLVANDKNWLQSVYAKLIGNVVNGSWHQKTAGSQRKPGSWVYHRVRLLRILPLAFATRSLSLSTFDWPSSHHTSPFCHSSNLQLPWVSTSSPQDPTFGVRTSTCACLANEILLWTPGREATEYFLLVWILIVPQYQKGYFSVGQPKDDMITITCFKVFWLWFLIRNTFTVTPTLTHTHSHPCI